MSEKTVVRPLVDPKNMRGKKLRPDLAILPSDLVTKETQDQSRVHEADESHTRDALVYDYFDQERKQEEDKKNKKRLHKTVTQAGQRGIDAIRLKTFRELVKGAILSKKNLSGISARKYHLWFETNSLEVRELRPGYAPPDSSRPDHLRGLRLEIATDHIDPSLADFVRQELGQETLDDIEDELGNVIKAENEVSTRSSSGLVIL